jgi:hypothetical protein
MRTLISPDDTWAPLAVLLTAGASSRDVHAAQAG